MPDDRGQLDDLDALDRAVSEAAWGGGIGTRWEIEPSLAATIRTVGAMQRSARPAPAFTERLSAQLSTTTKNADARSSSGTLSRFIAGHVIPNVPQPFSKRSSPRRQWVFAQVSLVLLLVVMASGLWLMVSGNHQSANNPDSDISTRITASVPFYTATHSAFVLRRITVEPGTTYSSFQYGPALSIIETGTFSVTSSTSRDEQTVTIGDTVAAPRSSTFYLKNISNDVGTLFVSSVVSVDAMRLDITHGPGVTAVTIGSGIIGVSLPLMVEIALQRLTVPVGERVNSWTTAGSALLRFEQGEIGLTLTGEQVPAPFWSGVERTQSSGQYFQLLPGVTIDARNTGDTPLVITIVTISPVPEATP